MDNVVVLHGDTAVVQYGIGTFGSRATAVGGAALYLALQEIKTKMRRFGEMLLESDDVTLASGRCVCNKSGRSVSVGDISGAAYRALKLPPGVDPGLVATRFWEPSNFAYPFGAHIAVTEIDKETGEVSVLRYVACDDCGNIINPLLVAGQVHGGVAQGIGQSLMEHVAFDAEGQLLSGSLMDYTLPRAQDLPMLDVTLTCVPTDANPLGVKGTGQAGAIAAPQATIAAVLDALAPLGVTHIDRPATPERVWRAIQGAKRT